MEKLHYSIEIEAPREKVWVTMLQDKTYRQWTEPFHKGSYYKGKWDKGSEIQFLAPDEGGESGMFSRVAENREYEFISIEHLGIIMNGEKDLTSPEAKKWSPAFENYTFTKSDIGTLLEIDVDTNEEYKIMFQEMWPKALKILKELCEK